MCIILKQMIKATMSMLYSKIFPKCSARPVLGRWSLKHNCPTEDITVLNENRDHCGDALCGDPKEYRKLMKVQSSK